MQAMLGPFMEQQLAQMRFYHEVPVVTELKAGWERAIWSRGRATSRGRTTPLDP